MRDDERGDVGLPAALLSEFLTRNLISRAHRLLWRSRACRALGPQLIPFPPFLCLLPLTPSSPPAV